MKTVYSVRLDGDVRRLMKKLGKMKDIDLKGANLVLAEALRSSTRQRFKDEVNPDGRKWESSIRATNEGGTTLTDTAGLKNSIKSTADKSGFAVGTNKIYAKTHQFGDERTIKARTSRGLRFKINGKWVTKKKVDVSIPERAFIGISEEDMQEIKGTLEDLMSRE